MAAGKSRMVGSRFVALVAAMSLVAAACGGGESEPSSTTGAADPTTTTAPPTGTPTGAEVEAIVITDGLDQPVILQLAPGDHGVASIELFPPEADGVDRFIAWDEDGNRNEVTVDGDTFTVVSDAGSLEIAIRAGEAFLTWTGADGSSGTATAPAEVPPSDFDASGPINAMPAVYRAPEPVAVDETAQNIGRVSGSLKVRYGVESPIPTPLRMSVDPCDIPFAAGDVTLTCQASHYALGSSGRFTITFEAEVPVESIPIALLSGQEAADIRRQCQEELNAVSGGLGWTATAAGLVGLLFAVTTPPGWVAGGIAVIGVTADIASRNTAPDDVEEQCERRLVQRRLDPTAADLIRNLSVGGLAVNASAVVTGFEVENPVAALSAVTPFASPRPTVDAGTFRVRSTDSEDDPDDEPEPEEPVEPEPRPVLLVIDDIPFTEKTSDNQLQLNSQATIRVEYDETMAATVSGSVQGGANWRVTFQCFNPGESDPTGDEATVRYSIEYGTTYTHQTQAAEDGSFTFTTDYAVPYEVTFRLVEEFSEECAHLNGDEAPGIGGATPTGQITVTVNDRGRATIETRWRGPEIYEDPGVPAGNERRIEGSGSVRGSFVLG